MAAKKTNQVRKFPLPTPHDYEVIKSPVVTEKSMKIMQTKSAIVLKCDENANATEIKKAFEAIFNKKVARVNTVRVSARAKKLGRFEGTVPGYKKAFIKLAEGETLDLFEESK